MLAGLDSRCMAMPWYPTVRHIN